MEVFSFGKPYHEFLDESGYVPVGDNLALPFLHSEYCFGDLDGHILPDLYLAAETPVVMLFTPREEACLGWQY